MNIQSAQNDASLKNSDIIELSILRKQNSKLTKKVGGGAL